MSGREEVPPKEVIERLAMLEAMRERVELEVRGWTGLDPILLVLAVRGGRATRAEIESDLGLDAAGFNDEVRPLVFDKVVTPFEQAGMIREATEGVFEIARPLAFRPEGVTA